MKLKRNPITIVYSAIFVLIMALALMNLAVLTYDKFAVDGLQNVLSGIVLVIILLFFIGAFFIKEGEKLRAVEKESSGLIVTEGLLIIVFTGAAFYFGLSDSVLSGIYGAAILLLTYAICRLTGGRFNSFIGMCVSLVSLFFYYEIGNSVYVAEEYINSFCILIPFLLFIIFIKLIVPRFSKKTAVLILCELIIGFIFAVAISINPIAMWLIIGCFLSLIFGRGREAYNNNTKGIVVGGVILIGTIIFTVVLKLVTGGDLFSILSFNFSDGFSDASNGGGIIAYSFEKISDELNAYMIAPYPYGIFPTLVALFAALGGVYTAMRRLSDMGGFVFATLGTLIWYVTTAPDNSHNYYYLFLIPVIAAYGLYNTLMPERFSSDEEAEDEEEEAEETSAPEIAIEDKENDKKEASADTAKVVKSRGGEPSRDELDKRAEELLKGDDKPSGSVVDDFDKAAKNAAVEAFKAELDRRDIERKAAESEEKERANKRTAEELTQSLADVAADSSTARPGYSAPVPLQKTIETPKPVASEAVKSEGADAEDSASTESKSVSTHATSDSSSGFMEWHVSEEFVREEEIAAMKAAKKAEEEAASEAAAAEAASVLKSDDGDAADNEEQVEVSNDIFGVPDSGEDEESFSGISSGVEDTDDEEEHARLSSDGSDDEPDEEEKNVTLDTSNLKFDTAEEEKNVTLSSDVGITEAPHNKIDPADTSVISAVNEEEQPLADKRIPEEITLHAQNDGMEGAVTSSYVPEADSVLGGAARAKYESSEALLSSDSSDSDEDEGAKEQAEELLSAIEHTIVPSVELPDVPEYDDEETREEEDEGDDVSMMKVHSTLADKESLANEGLQAVEDINGRLSAAAATLRGDATGGVMTPGEDELLDNLLDRLDMSESIRRMTESAREDIADVIEQDADTESADDGEDEVVLKNDAYDFGTDDEYGEVPTISDLEDRWRAEAELAKVDDADIPDVVSADELQEEPESEEEVTDVADEDVPKDEIEEAVSQEDDLEVLEAVDAAPQADDIEEATEDAQQENVVDIEEADKEASDNIADDFSFDMPVAENVEDVQVEEADEAENVDIDALSVSAEPIDDNIEVVADDNSDFDKLSLTVEPADELIEIDEENDIDELSVSDEPTDELVGIDEIEDETSDINALEGAAEGVKKPADKPVEFNDLVKLVFEDDENLGIPKPGEEADDRLEQAISREKHRNLFDENIHTEQVVRRSGAGTRSYHKIVIKKDE